MTRTAATRAEAGASLDDGDDVGTHRGRAVRRGHQATALVHHHLIDTAARTPDHPALVVAGAIHTFRDIDRASDGLAATLQAAGISRGDRVAIMGDNSAEVVVALFATLKAGGIFVIVNPTTKTDALTHVLLDSGARAMVAQGRLSRVILPALAQATTVTTTVWVGSIPPIASITSNGNGSSPKGNSNGNGHHANGPAPYAVAYEDAVAETRPPTDPGTIDDDVAALIYTSGSTGRPKGVMLTHRNIVHSAWSIATYLEQGPDDVVACVLPLAFGYGLFQVIVGARVGYTTVLEPSFAYPRDVLARMAEHGVTVMAGVPTIFATILQMAPLDDIDLSSLRQITNAAAALPPAHIARLRELLPGVDLVCMYGQTECTRISYLPPDRLDDKMGSVGKAIPNTEAYVVDEAGRRLPPGEVGELVVRGASIMRGYWGNPAATAATIGQGDVPGDRILHTGDRFRADEDGFLYFVGRRDDVFKCKGEKISPTEVEHVLYELEAVGEAAVVGVPDEIDGMAVKAVVAPRPGFDLTVEDVRHHCRRRLAAYMLPKIVEVRDSLPKTGSGKIRRAALAE